MVYFLDGNNDPPLKWYEYKKAILFLKSKSMKKDQLITAFEALNVNKNTTAYKVILDLLTGTNYTYRVFRNGPEPVIRTCVTEGAARKTTNIDNTDEIRGYLDKLGVEYEYTNDAPRKGKPGQILIIKTKIE